MSVTANPDRTNRRRHGHAGNGSCSACMLPDQSSASSRERRDRARAEDSCAQKKNKKKTNIRNGATKEVSSSATAVERRTHSLHTLRQPTDLGFHLADRKRRQPIGERLNVGHRQRTCPAANTRVGTRTGSATTHTHTHTHTPRARAGSSARHLKSIAVRSSARSAMCCSPPGVTGLVKVSSGQTGMRKGCRGVRRSSAIVIVNNRNSRSADRCFATLAALPPFPPFSQRSPPVFAPRNRRTYPRSSDP